MLSITSDSLSAGVLTVDFNGADNVAITQSGGSVLVNGASPAGGGSASSVTAINIAGSGNFDNVINLSGVGAAQGFTNLATVTVNTASAATGDQVELGTLNASGLVSVNSSSTCAVTLENALAAGSLSLTAASISLDSVTTSGPQTYNGPVTLGQNSTLSAGSGNVSFDSTIDGNYALTVNSSGTTTFGSSIGSATSLGSLTTNSAGTTVLSAPTVNGNDLTFNNPVVLGNNVTLSVGTGALDFNNTIDGPFNLTTTDCWNLTMLGAVGSRVPLSSANLDGTFTDLFSGGSLTTTGNQTLSSGFAGFTIGANTTLTAISGSIDTPAAVNGVANTAYALTINTGGTLTMSEAGTDRILGSLTTNAAGGASLNGNFDTVGAQTYNNPVTLGAFATFNGGSVTFSSTIDGGGITVNSPGTITFDGPVGSNSVLGSFTINGGGNTVLAGGSIQTTFGMTFNNPVTLANNAAIVTGGFTVNFNSTVDGPYTLMVGRSGFPGTNFNAPVGSITPLASLISNTGGTVSLENVTTTGPQIYEDQTVQLNGTYTSSSGLFSIQNSAMLQGDTTISAGSGGISLNTLNSATAGAFNLTLISPGVTTLGGVIGGTNAPNTLTTSSSGITSILANVTTVGTQSYGNPVALPSGVVLTSTSGQVFDTLLATPYLTTSRPLLVYSSNSGARTIDPNLTLSDGESGTLTSATVAITSGYSLGEDVLGFSSQNGITGSFNSATGTLTLSGTASVANYQKALASVTYTDTQHNASTAIRTISFQAFDGTNYSNMATKTAVLQQPSGPLSIVSRPSVTLTGLSQPSLMTFDASGDLFIANSGDGTGTTISEFQSGGVTPVATLYGVRGPTDAVFDSSGNLYVANFAGGLGSTVSKFAPGATTPTATLAGLSDPEFMAVDSSGNLYVGNEGSTTVSIFAPGSTVPTRTLNGVSRPGELTFDSSGNLYVANSGGSTVSIFAPGATTPTKTLTGLSSPEWVALDTSGDVYVANEATSTISKFAPGATTSNVTLTGVTNINDMIVDSQGYLYVGNGNNNTVSVFAPGAITPTVTLTGLSSACGLTFDSSGDLFVANHGGSTVSEFDSTNNLVPPSVSTSNGTLTYTANSGAQAIDPWLQLVDTESINISSATVAITSGYSYGEDVLGFTNQNGISGSFNATSGQLILSGSATIANYQAALASVTYNDTEHDASTANRIISFHVNDYLSPSNTASKTVAPQPTVAAPPAVTTSLGTTSYSPNSGAQPIDPSITVTDTESATITSATVSISAGYSYGEDVLGFTNQNGITGSFSATSGNLILTGSASAANYQTALQSVTYTDTENDASTAPRTISFTLNDGFSFSNTATKGVAPQSVTAPPVVAVSLGTTLYSANSGAQAIDPLVTVTDTESSTIASATVAISSGYVAGEDLLGFVSIDGITGSFNSGTGVLTLTGSASVGNYQAALQSVTYTDNNHDATTTSRTVSFTVNDGTSSSNTATKTVIPLNDLATQLVVIDQPPATVSAGSDFNLTVAFEDAGGNVVTNFSGNVTVALANNPGGSVLGGNVNVTASAGVVTVSGLTLNKIGSGYTVQVGGGGLASVTTDFIQVVPGALAQLGIFTQPPSSVTAGSSFGFTVVAEDAEGNEVPGFNGNVTVGLLDAPGGTTLGGVLTAQASNSMAQFSGLTINAASTGYTLLVSSPGLGSASTSQFAVAAGPATQWVIITEPAVTIGAGNAFGFTVAAEDAFGNVANYSGNVTVALSDNPGSSTLGGTLTQTAASGFAEFSDLTLNNLGAGYTLTVTGDGLPSTTTVPFDVGQGNVTVAGGSDGSNDDISVTFVNGSVFQINNGGTSTTYNTTNENSFVYNAPTDTYSKFVFDDPSNQYTVTQTLTGTELVSTNGFVIDLNNVTNLYVYGSANSTATVNVSSGSAAGNNFFVDSVNGGYSYLANPTTGAYEELSGFGGVTVTGSGATTYAYIYSTPGAQVVGGPGQTTYTQGGITSTLSNFSQVYVVGSPDGTDSVTLNASGGVFVSTPSFSYVEGTANGSNFFVGALYAAKVTAQAAGPADKAIFYSYANDTFDGAQGSSSLSGSAVNLKGVADSFVALASQFSSVSVFESGSGTDVADLTSPGQGSFYGTSLASTLTIGTNTITVNTYFVNNNQTSAVPSQIVVTGSGTDTATLYDSVGNNAISAIGSSATLTTAAGTLTINKFATVTANQVDGTHDTVHESAIDFALSTVGNWTSV